MFKAKDKTDVGLYCVLQAKDEDEFISSWFDAKDEGDEFCVEECAPTQLTPRTA